MKKMRTIVDTSTKIRGYWRDVDLGRSESDARRGEKRDGEHMGSENANVERVIGGVLIYTSSIPDVHFLTVSPGGVYLTSKEREVECASTTTSNTEVDTGILSQMK